MDTVRRIELINYQILKEHIVIYGKKIKIIEDKHKKHIEYVENNKWMSKNYNNKLMGKNYNNKLKTLKNIEKNSLLRLIQKRLEFLNLVNEITYGKK